MRPLTLQGAPVRRRRTATSAAKPETLRLRPSDVDVWTANLDTEDATTLAAMQALLSADEVQRSRTFYFERDRRRFVVGRGILRVLLSRYTGVAARDIAFRYGPNGKPALANPEVADTLHFNVAHSEALALYAFTRVGEVGIDVEWMRDLPNWEQVAEAVFSPRELAQLRACPVEQRRDEFFQAWTRQEAVLKALGTGLGGAAAAGAEAAYHVYPLHPAPCFAAALAALPAGRWTTFHTWQHDNATDSSAAPRRSQRLRLEPLASNDSTSL